jgi:hypothetical protein
MTWILLVLLCPIDLEKPLPGGAPHECLPAPGAPPIVHYFARERCEAENAKVEYKGTIPEGARLEHYCEEVNW